MGTSVRLRTLRLTSSGVRIVGCPRVACVGHARAREHQEQEHSRSHCSVTRLALTQQHT